MAITQGLARARDQRLPNVFVRRRKSPNKKGAVRWENPRNMAVFWGFNGKIIQHPPAQRIDQPEVVPSPQPSPAHLFAGASLLPRGRPTNCRAPALRGAAEGEVGVVDGRLSHWTPRKAPVKAPPVADFNMFFWVLGGGGWVKGWVFGWVFVNFGWVLAEYWVNFEVFAGKNGWKLGLEA